ncbi:MAG: ankyrin repeat domain-containing protein [Planctomycetota bacterium]|jgi:ankyrin repeat protein
MKWFCVITSIMLLWGCESRNQPTPKSPKAVESTVVQAEPPKATAEKPVPPQAKKTKPATQAFFDAALNGDIQTVESELSAGVDVNATSLNGQNQTALMLAAFNGHRNLVEILIARGGKVNHLDVTHRTALMYCCSGPFPETAQLLLDHGADVNIIDNNEKWTALMFAAAEGQVENVKILLKYGADWKLTDIDGDTAASFAAKNGHQQVAQIIEEHAKSNP